MSNDTQLTPEQLEYLVGKALLEPEFRKRFLEDPAAAAKSLQITLTADQVAHIKSLNKRVMEDLADAIDQLADPQSIIGWVHTP